jgi:hypothetical protein
MIDKFLIDNFENLQGNYYKIFISVSNISDLLKTYYINLPDKTLLINKTDAIYSKVSIDHQLMIETLANLGQLINSNSIELSNLPKTSYFEYNFLTLNNMLKISLQI